MFLLDTNVISGMFKGNTKITNNSVNVLDSELYTCSIVEAEIFFGVDNAKIENQAKLDKFYNSFFENIKVLSFDSQSAQTFRKIKSDLYKAGTPIENFDIAIASIALTHNLTLVTNNTKHFKNITGLNLVDWSL
jgi:tRNA(fMet)-specific endonuclease VapC